MKTIAMFAIASFTFTFTSCVAPAAPRNVPPAVYPAEACAPAGQPQMGEPPCGQRSSVVIHENGHQGGFLQRRHADGTPVGNPIWVPGAAPGSSYGGLPVHVKHEVRMPAPELDAILAKYAH